jgi:hypothetical protein
MEKIAARCLRKMRLLAARLGKDIYDADCDHRLDFRGRSRAHSGLFRKLYLCGSGFIAIR